MATEFSESRRLLLTGWDSADWKIIHPLVQAGKMPVVARLLQAGVCGNLTTIEPQLSPMLWTSIATGKHACKHGVAGFTEVNDAGQVVPVSAATRRCKALWDILGESGLKSHVVGWFATQGEQPEGCLVSNLYHTWQHNPTDAPEDWPPPPPGTYWPEDLGEHLNVLRVSPWDIDPDEVIKLLVPDADKVDQKKDQRLWFLAKRLSEAFSVHSASCWLMQNRPDWNLFAVYFRAIDEICHRFMPYQPPQMEGVPDEDFAMYRHVVEGAYRLHDLMLAQLINLAGPEAAVMLVSDHGFHSDHLRPRFTPRVPAGITVWHRPQGIFCAMGEGFVTNGNLFGARLLDVAPTVLSWFGLPVGEDMDGRVLPDAFTEPNPPRFIPSWETTGKQRCMAKSLQGSESRQLIDQFVDLGYIEPISADSSAAAIETNRENDWNLARASMDEGRYEEALPLLESVYQLCPQRTDYAQMLSICQLRLGLREEAERTLQDSIKTLGGITADILLMQANIALESGASQRAVQLLDEAGKLVKHRPDAGHCELIARAHLSLRQWEKCVEACAAVLELDPHNPRAYLMLARCALHRGRSDEVVSHALDAIRLQYGNPKGHFLLGVALVQQKKWSEAIRALATVIQLSPSHAVAHRYIALALEQTGQNEAAEGARFRGWELRVKNEEAAKAKLDTLRRESSQRAEQLRRIIAVRKEESEAKRIAAEKQGLPAESEFLIVSGLPRSGTSLMMQMLHAGGMEIMTDGKRTADNDNPNGYFEWEAIRHLRSDPLLIEQAFGKVVKVVTPLLPALPRKHRYKIIFMTRPVDQVVASQAVMLRNRGTAQRATTAHLERLQSEQVERTLDLLRKLPYIKLLEVPYPELVKQPESWTQKIAEFIGVIEFLSAARMADVVTPELHRQR